MLTRVVCEVPGSVSQRRGDVHPGVGPRRWPPGGAERGGRWHRDVSRKARGPLGVEQGLPAGLRRGRQPVQRQLGPIALRGLGRRVCRGCSVWGVSTRLLLRAGARAGAPSHSRQPRLTRQPGAGPGPGVIGPSQSPELQSVVSRGQGPRERGAEGSRAPRAVPLHRPTEPEQIAVPGTRPRPPARPERRGPGQEQQVQRGRGIWGDRAQICAEHPPGGGETACPPRAVLSPCTRPRDGQRRAPPPTATRHSG